MQGDQLYLENGVEAQTELVFGFNGCLETCKLHLGHTQRHACQPAVNVLVARSRKGRGRKGEGGL